MEEKTVVFHLIQKEKSEERFPVRKPSSFTIITSQVKDHPKNHSNVAGTQYPGSSPPRITNAPK